MILLVLSLAWLGGVALAALGLLAWSPLPGLLLLGAAAGLMAAGRPRRGALVALMVVAGAFAVFHYDAARAASRPGAVVAFNDAGRVRLRGEIADEPEEGLRSQRFRLEADAVEVDGRWQETSGRVLVTTRLFPRLAYGDRLELEGRLETPPRFDGFDYREYLTRQGIGSVAAFPSIRRTGEGGGSAMRRTLIGWRAGLGGALERALPEPEAALAKGILLGDRSGIPRDLTDDFNRAGISHLVAISGANVTIVAGMVVGSLAWLIGRRRASLAAMAVVLFFAVFVGAEPSVLRAAVMGVFMLGAGVAGRPGSALSAVVFAAALLTLAEPLAVDDVSFQLSFAATLGLVLLEGPLRAALASVLARVAPAALVAPVAENLAVTAAATLAVLPITVATFARVSLVALPANLLAVPAFVPVIVTAAVTALAGSLADEAGAVAGYVARAPLRYIVWVGRAASSVPGASVGTGDLAVEAALAACLVLGGAAGLLLRRRARERSEDAPKSRRLGPALPAAVLLLAFAAFTWSDVLAADGGRLTVSVLDVGQGDAILVRTPGGQTILVDGGPSGRALTAALGRELPAGLRRIELVVLTHPQDDHVTGLVEVLERYEVGAVLTSSLPGTSAAFESWQQALARRSVRVHEAAAGEWLVLGEGVRLQVLGPPAPLLSGTADDVNNASIVLRLVYRDVSFLLTGDVAAEGEAALLRAGGELRSTVLKVAHHGSDGSTTDAFLRAARPRVAAISAGATNSFGHPSPTTQLRLAGVPFYRTDVNGRIRFETDGRRLWASVERGSFRLVRP